MNWTKLEKPDQLAEICSTSETSPVLIYKHSTRCSTSALVLNRLERHWNQADVSTVKPYFLDLLKYRDISNAISQLFQIQHESPQILLIVGRKAVYERSHHSIDYFNLKEVINRQPFNGQNPL